MLFYKMSSFILLTLIKHFTGSIEPLKSNWNSLLQPFEVDSRVMQKVFLDLVTAYSSAGRFYHTLEHIQQMLDTIEQMRKPSPIQAPLAIDFPTIQLAAWFHDVIYDPRAKDNEEKSAEYAASALNQLQVPITTIDRIKALILNTKTHQAAPTDLDSQVLLDSDLAILGASELEYRVYAQAIRQEYAWVPDPVYRTERKQVLQSFLQQRRLYFTEQMFVRLEERAKRNLQAEITAL
jgi:predicted metal-dependent HD superfamily phosphohydrolase